MMNMKRLSILLTLFLLVCFLPSCNFYKDQIDELYSEVDSLKRSDSVLRQRLDQMNSSLSTLQGLVSAMQSSIYIKSIVTLTGDETQSGYLITMSNGVTYTIRDGRNGVDGVTPRLGVKRGDDGAYYWTLDGEFLRDGSGNPVRADGARPLFDIRDGFWFISLDGGTTWENMGRATGENGLPGAPGDQIFKSVEYTPGENVVKFVLSDDTSITLPCYQPIAISFNVPENQTSINAGETIKVDYSLSYGDENTVVTASSDGNYIVNIEARDAVSGSILITCPGLYMDGHVNVMAFDGVGYATVAVITFYEKQMVFGTELSFSVPMEGGTIDIPVSYNFGYTLEPVADADSWIKVVRTRADMQDGRIQLDILRNEGEQRTGKVYLIPENSISGPFAVITINQEGSYFEIIGKSSFIFGSDGGEALMSVRTSKPFSVDVPSGSTSWVSVATMQKESGYYELKVSVGPNQTAAKRQVSIHIKGTADGEQLGTIEILQLTGSGDSELDMVFEVSANESNDYTVYLPVNGYDGNDFIVDWGDGTYDRVNGSIPDPGAAVSHKYTGIDDIAATFRIALSGTVRRLNSDIIPEGLRSGIVSVVQWGNTGLETMHHAFIGNTRLVSLPADETLAFGEVYSFCDAFANCPRLVQIDPGLFAAAKKANDFQGVFSNCENLQVIPGRLFSACVSANCFDRAFSRCLNLVSLPSRLFECRNAEYFNGVFSECRSLIYVPEDLFAECTNVRYFNDCFRDCSRLEVIPGGLFAYSPKVKEMAQLFKSCPLFSIPVNLFWNNPELEHLSWAFRECNNLTSIPAHLFDACPSLTSVEQLFCYCYNLKTIPIDLFDNQRKISNFNNCFYGCWNWVGESPYTWVDGRKVHLYERSDYPDYFVTPTYHDRVFGRCDNLIDINSVPANWR